MISGRTAQTYLSTPERIWHLITATTDISWRPSVSAASADGASSYRETNRRTGYTTEYTIINDQPGVRRDMNVKHTDGTGTCSYVLIPNADGTTTFEISQEFDFHGPRLIQPLVTRFLRNERRALLADIGRALA